MFLRKFWNQWTLEENARRMTITVLPSGTKKVHLKEPNELAELYPDRHDLAVQTLMIFSQAFRNEEFSPAVALFSAAGLIKTTAGIKEEHEEQEQQRKQSKNKGD
uniref:Uncharacterized protein n=1 Tax=Caenorhabditis japonica TaxID=281687 RepID=A0A8R1EHI0_CAEJA